MTLTQILSALTPLDIAGLIVLVGLWAAVTWLIEKAPPSRPSVSQLMEEYRRAWMREFARREARVFDASLITNLRQSTAYFASTTLIAVGALLALIGNTQPLQLAVEGLTGLHGATINWQLRMIPPTLFLVHAFLKFVWANRVFGYCAVLMGAVPVDIHDLRSPALAAKAAELNIRAAYNFNRGLRSMYFALGALAWLISPVALIAATGAVAWFMWSREFRRHTHAILLAPVPELRPRTDPARDASRDPSRDGA